MSARSRRRTSVFRHITACAMYQWCASARWGMSCIRPGWQRPCAIRCAPSCRCMNSACPPWDDRQRLPRCPLCCRGGQPGPATHLQFVQAAVKMENAPDLSLRGGRRPTRRPERAARGSALGVQSWEGTHDFADDFPVIQLGAARFPRRFAPRNDKSGSLSNFCDFLQNTQIDT